MQQSSALRRLEELLNEAVTLGNKQQPCGFILLEVIGSQSIPRLMEFYELLSKAKEEARNIKNKPKLDRYLKILDDLCEHFLTQHVWGTPWSVSCNYIEQRDFLTTLDSLADFYHYQNPNVFLEREFLEKLDSELTSLLNNIFESDLSKDLKRFLSIQIESILKAIRRYHIDGTEGLEKATKLVITELMMTEHKLKDKDKKNPIFTKITSTVISLSLFFIPTSIYDIIGAVPDIHEFWVPNYQELVATREKVAQITCETVTIQEKIEKVLDAFDKEELKRLTGTSEPKLLSPAEKNDLEASTNDESQP
jgi:hypothetical protein